VDAALRLREEVFCGEQGVDPAAERDGRDPEALHLVALREGELVATCRLVFDGRVARLGRMAVASAARRAGIGMALLEVADREAGARGARRIELHAQTRVEGLYASAGYRPYGERFEEQGIEHVAMEKRIALPGA
jgi:predicted GNAT family N-acyltransferase